MVQDKLGLRSGAGYVPNAESVLSLVKNSASPPISLWGVAPVAPIHLGYDELIVQQKNFISLGCRHIVLLADLHAMMTHSLSFADATARALYYQHYLNHCCDLKAQYIKGSDFQMRIDYIERLFTLASNMKASLIKDTLPASVRRVFAESGVVSTYLYALMQCLDVHYIGADLVVAEHGQKKIYDLQNHAQKYLIRGGRSLNNIAHIRSSDDRISRQVCFVYIPTGRDIRGKPLAESSAATRISIHETKASLERKVKKMFAPPAGQSAPADQTNALLEHFRFSIFPWISSPIEVKGEDGKTHKFQNYGEFATAYKAGLLHPSECKKNLVEKLWQRLHQIQESWREGLTKWVDTDMAVGLEQE